MTEKSYICVSDRSPSTRLQKALLGATGMILSPAYWLLAFLHKAPGMQFRAECAKLGIRLFFSSRNMMPAEDIYYLLFGPMDSTRYFEFDALWRALSGFSFRNYLDVSSPRLFPAIVIDRNPQAAVQLINPDTRDLQVSEALLHSMGIDKRCCLHNCVIADAPLAQDSFDLITSISVLEHIPDDEAALQKMWSCLKPGGRLLITVPCAAKASEQYINRNEYGILPPAEDKFYFWQRFYDGSELKRLFAITGCPSRQSIYGEKKAGAFQKNAAQKRTARYYPLWKEPYMMASEYRGYASVEELPGEGVAALEFRKSL